MGLRHPISPLTGTDIALVQERANQTLSELLLLVLELMLIVLFLALGIIRFLRRVVSDESRYFSYFSHVDTFLSPAQEARTPTSSSGLLSSPVSSSLPASSGPPSSSPFLESLSTTQSSSPDSSSSSPELLITSRSSVLKSFINELSLKSSPPLSSLPRSPHSSSSLPVPAPPSVSSSLPRSSLRSSLRPSGPVSPPVLSIKPSSSSPSSSSPSPGSQSPVNNDKTITLTGQKLLKELGLPATLASFRLLISLGVLDENLLPSSLLAPSPPAPVSSSSPPPYVPPHIRRQASVPSSSPTSSSLPEDSASIRPPLVRTIKVSKGYFYCHNKHPSGLPHAHRNHYPWFHYHLALCLGPKRDEGEQDENVEKRSSNPVVFSAGF
ncbi:hypothetical protein N431DRAFT_434498 [Stipitochalara longipes BDJ]|nr:hypothetical protein N431DRAFT_434498 [Stipitochalara longipes BDJ]